MSLFIVLIVLLSALLHASWNLLLKQVTADKAVFVWLQSAVLSITYLPIVLTASDASFLELTAAQCAGLGLSIVVVTLYYFAALFAYRLGDLSVVYPVARGISPLVLVGVGIFLLDESMFHSGAAGASLVVFGILLLPFAQSAGIRQGIVGGIFFGVVSSLTYLTDRYVAVTLALSPVLIVWVNALGRVALCSPMVLGRFRDVGELWRADKWRILAIGAMQSGGTMLFMVAMRHAPLSTIAPLRECSIVFGILLGRYVLQESVCRIRWVAAGAILTGGLLLAST